MAGVLELADREFDCIAKEIDSYAQSVVESTKKGDLEIPINTTSLYKYLVTIFENRILTGLEPNFGSGEGSETIVNELINFGITDLNKLARIIPADFIKKGHHELKTSNFTGLLRSFMMIADHKRYFSEVWKSSWSGLDYDGYLTLKAYDVPVDDVLEIYDIFLEPPDDDEDPF